MVTYLSKISLREKLQESLSAQKETSNSTRQVPPVILMEADGQSLPRDAILLKDIESYGSKAGVAYEPVALKSTDTAVLMYTSGTTSMAKGVNLTHGQVTSLFHTNFFIFSTGRGAIPIFMVIPSFVFAPMLVILLLTGAAKC